MLSKISKKSKDLMTFSWYTIFKTIESQGKMTMIQRAFSKYGWPYLPLEIGRWEASRLYGMWEKQLHSIGWWVVGVGLPTFIKWRPLIPIFVLFSFLQPACVTMPVEFFFFLLAEETVEGKKNLFIIFLDS